MVAAATKAKDEAQEKLFLEFVVGTHACVLDWRATREDLYEKLLPPLRANELAVLPQLTELPEDTTKAVAAVDR